MHVVNRGDCRDMYCDWGDRCHESTCVYTQDLTVKEFMNFFFAQDNGANDVPSDAYSYEHLVYDSLLLDTCVHVHGAAVAKCVTATR